MITDIGKQYAAYVLGGSNVSVPTYFIIGSGSGTALSSQTELIYPLDRQAVTSTDLSTAKKITYTGDWNAIEMSGLFLTEFGMMQSGAALTGSIWSRTSMPSITFNGSNELRIVENWEVF